MSSRLALSLSTLLLLAAPLAAQGREFRASGFAITLPPGFEAPEPRPLGGTRGEAYLSRGKDAFLVMLDLRPGEAASDTSLASRRALLATGAAGAMRGRGLQVEAGPEERVTPDAVVARFRVVAPGDPGEKPHRGPLDVMIPRRGEARMLMVGVLSSGTAQATEGDVLRALDSFRPLDLAAPDLFAWIAGTWRWSPGEGGSRDPFTLAVGPDRSTVTLTYRREPDAAPDGDSVFVYRVLGVRPDAIQAELVRRDAQGGLGRPGTLGFRAHVGGRVLLAPLRLAVHRVYSRDRPGARCSCPVAASGRGSRPSCSTASRPSTGWRRVASSAAGR